MKQRCEIVPGIGLFFEKEEYSILGNENALQVIDDLMKYHKDIVFDVMGYCLGGYCVDEAVKGLLSLGAHVRILSDAVAAIGGQEGIEKSKQNLKGAEWI